MFANTDSLGEPIQRAFPDARVVKSLNTMHVNLMVNPARVPGRHNVFVAGDAKDAKETVNGPLRDVDWVERRWDSARAYAASKLYVVALAFALSRGWPEVLSNAVDPGWARSRMGGPTAPVSLDTRQRTQNWLAVSDEPAGRVSGGYWYNLRRKQPASAATDVHFQDQLISALAELTGVVLP